MPPTPEPTRAPAHSDPAARTLGDQDAAALAKSLKALADPNRLRLVRLVFDHGGEACVCDLADGVRLSQPTVSHHLKTLVSAGILRRERRGAWAYYSTVPGAVDSLARRLTSHLDPV